MGRNSGPPHVAEVFAQLQKQDVTGARWLPALLGLFEFGHPESQGFSGNSDIQECCYGDQEKKLAAPRSLLAWLLEHAEPEWIETTLARRTSLSHTTRTKRAQLAQRNPETLLEAQELLSQANISKPAWFILEGSSQPDLFLVTPELILVLEGKRTEAGPTQSTDYMRLRPQMLRHLDVVWEIREGRTVLGGLIVDGKEPDPTGVPELWQRVAHETLSQDTLDAALPHRSKEDKQALAKGFLGVMTWQKLCLALDLNVDFLPDSVQKSL